MGDAAVGAYLNCGRKSLSNVLVSDAYPIRATVIASLRSEDDGRSGVQLALRGRALGTMKDSGQPIDCESTGRMEAEIARLLGPAV